MTPPEFTRNQFLRAGAGAALAAGLGPSTALAASKPRWPSAALPASAAAEVDPAQFFSAKLLGRYGTEADRLGLRATGTPHTEAYIKALAGRLRRAGLKGVTLEPAPLKRWTATSWGVELEGKTLEHTFYVPYSKPTEPAGLTAPMMFVGDLIAGDSIDAVLAANDVAGKIAVFEVSYTELPLAAFQALSYGAQIYNPDNRPITDTYRRPWFNSIAATLDKLSAAGAVGTIGIWTDLPGEWAKQYTPYDSVFRPIPGLWVDKYAGEGLKQYAAGGAPVTIKLQAKIRNVTTNNLYGFIPGKSKELTVLHTHTDGTNGMEENGQIGILAAAQYLARLPKSSRERSIMVFLSSGHFADGVGIRTFLDSHRSDLVPRITSIQTLEHLGCLEWLPNADGVIAPTGKPELGAYFAPDSRGLVTALRDALTRNGFTGSVIKPFVGSKPGSSKSGWPGEGTYFQYFSDTLDGNFISGPYGLITAGLKTDGMVDYKQFRRQAMTAVHTTLQLASTSAAELAASNGLR